MARSKAPVTERFWSKVDKTGDCWVWMASKGPRGYGLFQIDGAAKRAHRVAWELIHGAIPAGLFVCHRCDNPSCVRPSHLFLGTDLENVADMHSKGRARKASGDRHWTKTNPENLNTAKLNPERVREIRRLHSEGVSTKDLAERFELGRLAIQRVVSRRTWRGV